MGKFRGSEIHDKYSNWHYELIKQDAKYKKLLCSDIDRIWIEVDFKTQEPVVCVLDLKFDEGIDSLTPTEALLRKWFISKGARYYILFINRAWDRFRLVNEQGEERLFTPIQFADFLLMKRKIKKSLSF